MSIALRSILARQLGGAAEVYIDLSDLQQLHLHAFFSNYPLLLAAHELHDDSLTDTHHSQEHSQSNTHTIITQCTLPHPISTPGSAPRGATKPTKTPLPPPIRPISAVRPALSPSMPPAQLMSTRQRRDRSSSVPTPSRLLRAAARPATAARRGASRAPAATATSRTQ